MSKYQATIEIEFDCSSIYICEVMAMAEGIMRNALDEGEALTVTPLEPTEYTKRKTKLISKKEPIYAKECDHDWELIDSTEGLLDHCSICGLLEIHKYNHKEGCPCEDLVKKQPI